jgi:hypothetical protein
MLFDLNCSVVYLNKKFKFLVKFGCYNLVSEHRLGCSDTVMMTVDLYPSLGSSVSIMMTREGCE